MLLDRRRADGRDRQGRDQVRHADGPDRLARPRRPGHRVLCRQGRSRKAYPDRAVPSPILDELRQGGPARPEIGRGIPQVRRQGQSLEPDPGVRRRSSPSTAPATTFPTRTEITDRLFLPMLLEATASRSRKGSSASRRDVDMGLICGIGFPPFRGGILRWCDTEGASAIRREAREVLPTSASGSSRPRSSSNTAAERRPFYPASCRKRSGRTWVRDPFSYKI